MTLIMQVHKDDFTSHDNNNDGLLTLTEVAELLEHQLGRPGPAHACLLALFGTPAGNVAVGLQEAHGE